ncbi:MAG TPA: UvrD-helicase domain-containing protein [Candidatus Flavonifractor intestinipullorum]|uniref:DNA 3'-5' helicase n=1 Tax=Candidatus Flavonifractor intestinipullorum TaxID=2838587 RepID=A0A9D2S627_9FIRM|nr:UvrD-helicase domain-containing protein [Candidatus Flavonifractor intestinipullorum]
MRIADLHIHSKYSRATSRDCVPEALDFWARRKGIDLVGTGDFTHPAWRAELSECLEEAEDGLYVLKSGHVRPGAPGGGAVPRFVVSGEISSIYKKNGRVRKVHSLILLPSLEAAEVLSHRLEAIGNIHSDGRPILGLDCRDLLEITLEAAPGAIFIPAHIWTPHFSLFGAFSGFDTIEECFEDLTPHIHALETGLSSDPPMNYRVSALDRFHLVSHSDAHSPAKLGREADLLDIELSYSALEKALRTGRGLKGTIEFYPEEGKYHYDGHRNCHQCLSPAEAEALQGVCPVCGKRLTTGVLHRVEQLADRPEGYLRPRAPKWERLIPLPEVLSATLGGGPDSKRNQSRYAELLDKLGPEFFILRECPLEDLARAAGPCVAEGVRRLRAGEVQWEPGYDGSYGVCTLLTEGEREALQGQVSLFQCDAPRPKRRKLSTKAAPPVENPEETAPAAPAELNPEQTAAARSPERTVAVIAGPGAGKTKTLVSRILWLLEQGERPSEIAAVTFTNKAAGELRERLEAALGDRRAMRGMTIGTFHAICLELLSKEPGCPRLLGDWEALELAGQVLRALGIQDSPARLLQAVSRRKTGGGDQGELEGACDFYDRRLSERGLMDFDDLLLRTLAAWEGKSRSDARKFRHLLVDEFQDCSPAQYRLVRAWNRLGRSLFVIGDPDQSIYGFRGSDAACFHRLSQDVPDVHTVTLTRNYRSTPEILGCALSVIEGDGSPARDLRPVRPSGARVRLIRAGQEREEAAFVAREIGRLVGGVDMLAAQALGEGRKLRAFSDVAVCCRTRRQLLPLEQALRRSDIPCVVAGRDSFLRDDMVRGALCFFRSLLDPEDTLALEGALRLVWRCPADLARAVADTWAHTPGSAGARVKEIARSYAGVGVLSPWLELAGFFGEQAGWEPPWRLLERWAAGAGCTASQPLEDLRNTAVFYRTMPELLEGLTLGGEGDLWRRSGSYTSGAVSLMTFHAAKGLEFPVVFLCGVRKGVVPLESERRDIDLAEERRLLYVGMTRAQEELILLAPGEPSPFLEHLPSPLSLCQPASLGREKQEDGQMSLF